MQPKLSVVALFFLIACIIFVLGFFGDSVIKFFEDFEIRPESAVGNGFLVIGTPQEILSLQISKGEIQQYELFKRGEVGDPTQQLPKEFIFVKSDINRTGGKINE